MDWPQCPIGAIGQDARLTLALNVRMLANMGSPLDLTVSAGWLVWYLNELEAHSNERAKQRRENKGILHGPAR